MTIEKYIQKFQGTSKLIKWKVQGCEAFDDDYKSIKNVTIGVASILLHPDLDHECTWDKLKNNQHYSQLLQCTSMYFFVFWIF